MIFGALDGEHLVTLGAVRAASKKYHPVKNVDWEKWEKLGLKTRYYNPKLHAASFALPTYVEEILKSEEPEEE